MVCASSRRRRRTTWTCWSSPTRKAHTKMPTYEYECPRGHSFSRFDSVANWRELRPCEHPRCRETAQQFLRPSTGRFASVAKPIVVFKAKNRQIRVPGGADTKTPRGYDRV